MADKTSPGAFPWSPGYQPQWNNSVTNYLSNAARRFGQQIQAKPNVPPGQTLFLPAQSELATPNAKQSTDLLIRRASSEANEALYPYREPSTAASAAASRVSAIGESARNAINGTPPLLARPPQRDVGTVGGMLDQFGKGSNYLKAPVPTNQISAEGQRLLQQANAVNASRIGGQQGAPGFVDSSGFHSVNSTPSFTGPGGSFSAPQGSLDSREAERFARFGRDYDSGQRPFNVLPSPAEWQQQRLMNAPTTSEQIQNRDRIQ